MNPRIIVIDGKTYQSVDEMPPDIRQKYEQAVRALGDANGNRIPDAFETMNPFGDQDKNGMPDVLENIVAGQATPNSMKIIVDGKEFNGLDDLPPEARARYEQAMGHLDANRNGIPDFVEGLLNPGSAPTAGTATAAPGAASPRPRPQSPAVNATITPDTSNGWMLVAGGLFLLLVCAAALGATWYFFLR